MSNLWPIARITFLEGLRSRVFFGVFLVALLLFASTYTLSYLFPHDVVKVATDISLGITSLLGLLLTLFVGTQLLAKDFEKRTIHMVLAKAVSRSQYVVGKFAGLCLIVVCAMAVLGGFASLATWIVDATINEPYGAMHWPQFALSLVTMTVTFVLLTSVIFFFSSFASSTFLALGFTLVVYLIGHSVEEIKQFLAGGAESVAISPVFSGTVTIAYYVFPNLAALDFKTHAAHGLAVAPSTVIWTLLYGVFYIGVMIASAAWIFRRREFP